MDSPLLCYEFRGGSVRLRFGTKTARPAHTGTANKKSGRYKNQAGSWPTSPTTTVSLRAEYPNQRAIGTMGRQKASIRGAPSQRTKPEIAAINMTHNTNDIRKSINPSALLTLS